MQLVILDDHRVFGASLSRLLDDDEEIAVIGLATTIADLHALLDDRSPDVVVVDWQLTDGDGGDAIGVIRTRLPDCRILVLTGNLDDVTLERAVRAGSDGLVTKDRAPEDLVGAIRAVGRGEVAFDPSALARVLHRRAGSAGRAELSDREIEVIRLLADGRSNKEIAAVLDLSPNTVRNHIHRISGKLDAGSRLEVVVEAARTGIIDLPRSGPDPCPADPGTVSGDRSIRGDSAWAHVGRNVGRSSRSWRSSPHWAWAAPRRRP